MNKKRYDFVYNINKINALIKLKGTKKSYICEQLGLGSTYLADVERGKNKLTDERLEKIAAILGTTVDYLTDKTDDPKIPEEKLEREIIERIAALPEEKMEWLLEALDRLEKEQ